MKKLLLVSMLMVPLSLLACGDSDDDNGGNGGGNGLDLTTPEKIGAFLDGKTLVMTGADIPSHPNGYNEDVNFGAATQCYQKTTIAITGTQWTVTSDLGTLENAPNAGDTGTCNHDTKLTTVSFVSTNILIENVKGNASCFDVTATYNGFAQEGRASIDAAGTEVKMELFFKDQATGIRCADGDVGSGGITLLTQPFSGDAVQVYQVQ